jgi:hypothetical protein
MLVVALLLALGALPARGADFPAAYAALDAALAAPLCEPLDGRLASAIRRRLVAARALVVRADETPRPARAPVFLRRADRKLAGIARRAARAEARARITPSCRAGIDARIVALQATLAALGGATPLPGLPTDVAGYDQWLRLNAAPIPPAPASDPHRGTKNVFVNQARDALAPDRVQRLPYPAGSIVVKAVVRDGEDFVYLFSIMRKRPGSDPAHGDWQFVEYLRSSGSQPFRAIARDAVCWGCHGTAADGDYVFTPLDPVPPGRSLW